ncbi:hypothetical protein MMC18_005705 [Xylographa bjoerkii]|nr:hypothetical protein [Xylographa bjoerkii]
MSLPRLQAGQASGSMAVGDTHSLPIEIFSDGLEAQQHEDFEVGEIEYPDVQMHDVLNNQHNEDSNVQQAEGSEVHQTKVPTVQQNQVPNAQQNVGSTVQQAARRRNPPNHPDASKEVFEELRLIAERHGPYDRRKGVNISRGKDIINHKKAGPSQRPALTKLGVIVIALQLLQKMEREAREQPTQSESHAEFAYTLTGIPANVVLEMPEDSKRVLVDKDYLLRIEKTNELYHYHLGELEMGIVRRLEKGINDAVRGAQDNP